MTNTFDIAQAPVRPNLPTILWRIAMPFFMFSLVLASLLTLSWTLLLPRYTRIDVGGALRSASDIRDYRTKLTAEIAAREEDRRQSVLAVHDTGYDALKEHRRERMPLDQLRTAVIDHAKTVEKEGVVIFSGFEYDPEGKVLTMHGDIRNVGTSSMTVLADFALSLKDLPFVASYQNPAFARVEDPDIGPHSPFDITLSLK